MGLKLVDDPKVSSKKEVPPTSHISCPPFGFVPSAFAFVAHALEQWSKYLPVAASNATGLILQFYENVRPCVAQGTTTIYRNGLTGHATGSTVGGFAGLFFLSNRLISKFILQ
jgi:hypothetical protein